MCEGETEKAYFDAVRTTYGLTNVEVIVADRSDPIGVVESAERRARERGPYDHIYCVFDRDNPDGFEAARARIVELAGKARNALSIRDAISIPCFEIWVLLHYERTDRPFANCDQVVARVRDHYPEYEKASDAVALVLVGLIDEALANADWLAGRNVANRGATTVHELVRHLRATAPE